MPRLPTMTLPESRIPGNTATLPQLLSFVVPVDKADNFAAEDPLALPYALAFERFCARGSGADLCAGHGEGRRRRSLLLGLFVG